MAITGIVRRIDDLGRIVIPKEIRRTLNIKEGDALEISTTKKGGIFIKKYSRSFEECCHAWMESPASKYVTERRNATWVHNGDYTMCIVINGERTQYGVAKRYKEDAYDSVVGKVASYARAVGVPVNQMIGYEG